MNELLKYVENQINNEVQNDQHSNIEKLTVLIIIMREYELDCY